MRFLRNVECFSFFVLFSIMLGAAGCQTQQGSDLIDGVPIIIPSGSNGANPTGIHTTPDLGVSCASSDADHLCLGLKYVVYADSSGNPIVSQDEILNNVTMMNLIWNQCNIGFQIDQLVTPDPARYGLNFSPTNYSELDSARSVFSTNSLLLVVTTGTWNRQGTLGNTGANAWTNMPGSDVMGVVLEQPVGAYPNIIAHELGHYLNLGHVSDTSNVMNPIIYSNSTQLNSSQCDSSRAAAKYWWINMIRD
jgi:hypothetical protein